MRYIAALCLTLLSVSLIHGGEPNHSGEPDRYSHYSNFPENTSVLAASNTKSATSESKLVTTKQAKELIEKNPDLVRTLLDSLAEEDIPWITSTVRGMGGSLSAVGFSSNLSSVGFSSNENEMWSIKCGTLIDLGCAAVPDLLTAINDKERSVVVAALIVLVKDCATYADFPHEKVIASLLKSYKAQTKEIRPYIRLAILGVTMHKVNGPSGVKKYPWPELIIDGFHSIHVEQEQAKVAKAEEQPAAICTKPCM